MHRREECEPARGKSWNGMSKSQAAERSSLNSFLLSYWVRLKRTHGQWVPDGSRTQKEAKGLGCSEPGTHTCLSLCP